jgi:hypothetical protein
VNWKKILAIVIGIIVFIFWTYIPEDEYEDPDEKFSVTFTYDCREIIDDTDIPEHVIIECRRLMKDLQNELKTTQSNT